MASLCTTWFNVIKKKSLGSERRIYLHVCTDLRIIFLHSINWYFLIRKNLPLCHDSKVWRYFVSPKANKFRQQVTCLKNYLFRPRRGYSEAFRNAMYIKNIVLLLKPCRHCFDQTNICTIIHKWPKKCTSIFMINFIH